MNRNERGSALVEAALAIPLLVLLFAGAADFGRIFGRYHTIIGAVRDGAQVVMNARESYATAVADRSIADVMAADSAMPGLAASVSRFYTCPNAAGDDTMSSQFTHPQSCAGERLYVKLVTTAPFHAVMPLSKALSSSQVRSAAVVRVR